MIGRSLGELTKHGIIYPSIEQQAEGLNFCLTTDCANETLKPYAAWVVKVLGWQQKVKGFPDKSAGYLKCAPLAMTGEISTTGVLDWKPVPQGFSLEDISKAGKNFDIPIRNPYRARN